MALTRISNDTLQDATITQPKLGTEFTTSIVMPTVTGPLQNLYPGLAIDVIWYYGTTNGSGIDLYFYAINPNIAINELVGATFTFTGDNIGSIPAGSYIIGSNGASFVDFDEYYVEIVLNPTQQTDTEDGFGYGQQVTLLQASSVPTLNFNEAQIFSLTPNQNTTINITNPVVGISKVIIVTGGGAANTIGFTVGGAAGTFNLIAGEYDDTAALKNFIQIMCVSPTEFWYSISQIAV